jgi:hypothetical protein
MFRQLLIASLLLAAAAAHAQTAAPTRPQDQTQAPGRSQDQNAPPGPSRPQVPGPVPGREIPVARFSASDLSGWSDQPYKGTTSYTLEQGALKAHSARAASGKIRKLKVETKRYPTLTWSWRIDHTLKREDIKEKSGDDFAARVYVIFPRTLFWRMRAINYVWAAKMPKDSEARSPYTRNSVIIAVESGDDKAGKWVSEERNVYEDYKRIFGEEPPPMGGVAIMTDTDDTQDEVTAWYGDITLHAP